MRKTSFGVALVAAAIASVAACGTPPPVNVLAGKTPTQAVSAALSHLTDVQYAATIDATITVTSATPPAPTPKPSFVPSPSGSPGGSPSASASPSPTPGPVPFSNTLTLTDSEVAVTAHGVEHQITVADPELGPTTTTVLVEDGNTMYVSTDNGNTWGTLSTDVTSDDLDSIQGIATVYDAFAPTVRSELLGRLKPVKSSTFHGAAVGEYSGSVSNGFLGSVLNTLGNLQSPATANLGSQQGLLLITGNFLSLGNGSVNFVLSQTNGNLEQMTLNLPFSIEVAKFRSLLGQYGVSSTIFQGLTGSVSLDVHLVWTVTQYGKQSPVAVPGGNPPYNPATQIVSAAAIEKMVTRPTPTPSPSAGASSPSSGASPSP